MAPSVRKEQGDGGVRLQPAIETFSFALYGVEFDLTSSQPTFVLVQGVRNDSPSNDSFYMQSMAADGSATSIIPMTSTRMSHPSLSPDGTWVAASVECGNAEPAIWITPFALETAACEGRRLTSSAAARNPEWGPEEFIVYERGEVPRDLAIVAETGEECFVNGPGDDRNPSWAPETFAQPK